MTKKAVTRLDKLHSSQFISLMNSCAEGYTGEWDPSGDGRDGFMAMYDGLERLAKQFNVDVSKAKSLDKDEDLCESCNKNGETICGNDTKDHICYEGCVGPTTFGIIKTCDQKKGSR